jgi:hypothetical protein
MNSARVRKIRGTRKGENTELIFYGDGYLSEAHEKRAQLESEGISYSVSEGNGCISITFESGAPKHNCKTFEYEGELLTLHAIAKRIGIDRNTLVKLVIAYGPERAFLDSARLIEERIKKTRMMFLRSIHALSAGVCEER